MDKEIFHRKIVMNGKEYLEYIKYKDNKNKRFYRKLSLFFEDSALFFIVALILILVAAFLPSMLFPTEFVSKDYGTTIIYGFPIPNFLIYTIAVLIGFSWLFHGFGFIIIKR